MALNTQYSKTVQKRSSITGVIPTMGLTNDHTDGTWDGTSIYPGEYFYNMSDNRLWIGNPTGIIEIYGIGETYSIDSNLNLTNTLNNGSTMSGTISSPDLLSNIVVKNNGININSSTFSINTFNNILSITPYTTLLGGSILSLNHATINNNCNLYNLNCNYDIDIKSGGSLTRILADQYGSISLSASATFSVYADKVYINSNETLFDTSTFSIIASAGSVIQMTSELDTNITSTDANINITSSGLLNLNSYNVNLNSTNDISSTSFNNINLSATNSIDLTSSTFSLITPYNTFTIDVNGLDSDDSNGTTKLRNSSGGVLFKTSYLTIGAYGSTAGSQYTLPVVRGTNGQVLKTNGSGVVSWSDVTIVNGITGSGTTNRIPLFIGTSSIGDSYLLQSGNNILVDSGKQIRSSGAASYIDFQDTYLDISIPSSGNSQIYCDVDYTKINGKEIEGIHIFTDGVNPSSNSIFTLVPDSTSSKSKQIIPDSNVYINGTGTFSANIKGSVIIGNGLSGLIAKTNNTLYTKQLGYAINGTNESLLTWVTPTSNNLILIPNSSGTLTLSSGTIDRIPVFTGINTIGNSLVSQTSTNVIIDSGKNLQLGNTASTGLIAGVLSALTNASIVLYDAAGTAYRIPCIV